ncbi:hypothetical protein C2E23DRAFT_506677 [Lenzites betulinus]|nr:hypothetical protein C2E23DRAFT_506677 [Lenzites betulinus]
MPSVKQLSVAILLSASAFAPQVAALVRPRMPNAFLRPSKRFAIPDTLVDRSLGLSARAGFCPVGWAVCSSIEETCYPLDGSECCSDGNFCSAGSVCDVGGACCPLGVTCDGPAPPPITIGGGNEPTTTHRVATPTPTPTPTSTRSTTTSTLSESSATTPTASPTSTFDPTTEDPLELTIFSVAPDASVSATTPRGGSNDPQFPFGGTGGAMSIGWGTAAWTGVLLSGALGVLMSVV